jgi:hypothetical protein
MTKFRTTALALAGVLAVTAASTSSASAQWRRHGGWGWGPGIAAGVATGALIGSAVAARPYGYGYYYGDPGYAYAEPYVYDTGPTYYGSYGYNDWGWGRRVCHEGYRNVPCDGPAR